MAPVNRAAAEDISYRPHASFYLDATVGCYSASFISVKRVPMKGIKKVYRVACNSTHHYEVFWTGVIPFRKKSVMEQGKFIVNECAKRKWDKEYGRNRNSYNFSADEQIFIGNWMADLGPEYKRYGDKVVCYIVLGTQSTRYIKEIDQPILAGIENYEA